MNRKLHGKTALLGRLFGRYFFSKNNSFFFGLSKDGSLGCKLKQALFSQPCDGQFKSKTLQKAQKKGHFSLDLSKNR